MAKQGNPSNDALVEAYESGLYELAVLDNQLVELAGTQAQRLAEARAIVDEQAATIMVPDVLLSGSIADQKAALDNVVAEYTQWLDESVAAVMQVSGSATKEGRDALVEARDSLTKKIAAFHSVLTDMGAITTELVLPKRPGVRGPSSTSGSKVNAAFQFYTILDQDGKRRDQSGQQNSLSSINFYHGKKLLKQEAGKTSTEQLRAAVKSCGQDPDVKGTSWQVQLPGGIVGLDVVAVESDDNEDDGADTDNQEGGE